MEKLRKSNHGSSLIEVIVSMMILAIIVVPLLNMFVSSARINRKTQLLQYATTVAENVMESVMAEATGYTIESASADEEKEGCYTAQVTGLSQGTGNFTAEIYYDPSPYQTTDGLNDYSMPDISSLSSSDTVILDVDFTDEEASIADYFYQSHVYAISYINQELIDEAMNQYWLDWAVWYNWNEEEHVGETKPDEPNSADYVNAVTMETTLTESELEAKITRTVKLTIEQDTDTGLICIKANVTYLLPEDVNVGQAEGTAGTYSSDFFSSNWYAVSDLKQIYLLYQPYAPMLSATESVKKEQIYVDMDDVHLLNDFDADFFLVTQGTVASSFTEKLTLYMTSAVSANVERMTIYSKSNLAIYYENGSGIILPATVGAYQNLLVTLSDPKDMIYEVTVRIYEQGKTDQLAEVVSTLYH